MIHLTSYLITASIAIAVYLGLAVHVVTRNPRRVISWIFGAFCLTVAGFYLSSLFLFPVTASPSPVTPLPLRWKWAAISFGPTLYLHLVSFYFPPAWRRLRRWVLPPVYLLSTGFALAALFTDLLVAGPLYRPAPHIIGPLPGPLMDLFVGFFGLGVVVGTAGLIAGYRATPSPSHRRQILHLLTPTGLLILSGIVDWIIVLAQDAERLPHELSDASVILAGFLYAGAVLRYGSFASLPMARRDLFHSGLTASAGLVALYLTLTLDNLLMSSAPFPYPPATGMLVVIVAVSFPVVSRWAMTWLDRLLFQAERQQREMVHHLAKALVETPDPQKLQAELLRALCVALGVRGGYVALADENSPPGSLTVRAIHGRSPVRPGDQVRQPPLVEGEPQLAASLISQAQTEPGWREVSLFCPLAGNPSSGVLALGDKRNGKPFTHQDLTFCAELARHIGAAGGLHRLRQRRNGYLEAARLHDQALRQLGEQVVTSTHHALMIWEDRASQPANDVLEIRLLGPMQVLRNGQPVSEADWGTERAKALLAYMLWKGADGATREEISAALWPNRPADETGNVFHVTLHRLRRVLEPERRRGSRHILHRDGRYVFNPDAPHWLDVAALRALIRVGEPAALRKALSLYRGAYLEDAGWALPPEAETERRALEGLYASALHRLAAQVNDQERTLYLEKLLAVEPADEGAQRALVTSYLARGRRDLARRQVARWRETLAELELAPSPETRALWERVENLT